MNGSETSKPRAERTLQRRDLAQQLNPVRITAGGEHWTGARGIGEQREESRPHRRAAGQCLLRQGQRGGIARNSRRCCTLAASDANAASNWLKNPASPPGLSPTRPADASTATETRLRTKTSGTVPKMVIRRVSPKASPISPTPCSRAAMAVTVPSERPVTGCPSIWVRLDCSPVTSGFVAPSSVAPERARGAVVPELIVGIEAPARSMRSAPCGAVISGNWARACAGRATAGLPRGRNGESWRENSGSLAAFTVHGVRWVIFRSAARVAEWADAGDLKSPGGNPMRVRVPPRASQLQSLSGSLPASARATWSGKLRMSIGLLM